MTKKREKKPAPKLLPKEKGVNGKPESKRREKKVRREKEKLSYQIAHGGRNKKTR